jgi:hypothetical protein
MSEERLYFSSTAGRYRCEQNITRRLTDRPTDRPTSHHHHDWTLYIERRQQQQRKSNPPVVIIISTYPPAYLPTCIVPRSVNYNNYVVASNPRRKTCAREKVLVWFWFWIGSGSLFSSPLGVSGAEMPRFGSSSFWATAVRRGRGTTYLPTYLPDNHC